MPDALSTMEPTKTAERKHDQVTESCAKPEPEGSGAEVRKERPWLVKSLFAVAVLVTCGQIMAMNQADPDLWGHVQYGRELLRDGVLPRTTTWSFVAKGYPWINHEILAEVLLAATEDHLGTWGLTIGKYLISLLIVGLIYANGVRLGASRATIGLMCVVMALAMEFHWHFRPQVLGYLFFAMMLLLLQSAFAGWPTEQVNGSQIPARRSQLLWLLPLMVLWANAHGSFPAGVCVVMATLGLRGLERVIVRIRAGHTPTSPGDLKELVWLAGIAGGVVAATLATPYGYEMYVWLWDALHIPCAEIRDWERLPLWAGTRESLCGWIILLTAGAAIWKDSRRDWVNVIVFGLVAWQAVSHIRHLPMLAMVWACWFSVSVDRLRTQMLDAIHAHGSPQAAPSGRHLPAVVPAVMLTVWILGMAVLTWPKLAHLQVLAAEYPVNAFEFMAKNKLSGRTVVTFNWAQYAIGFFAHEGLDSTVAFDGRFRTCYSQETLDRYFDFIFGSEYSGPRYRSLMSGPIDPTKALTEDDPELVLISRLQAPSVREMQKHGETWTLLYQDGLAQIWGRRSLYDDPASPKYLAPGARVITDVLPTGIVQYPAYPNRNSSEPATAQLSITGKHPR